jgi:1-deoxy-D-xylulose-5-phosphate reductoisomerase
MPKFISILGSTGSIGTSALQVMRHLGEDYRIAALAARANIDVLEKQIQEFRPRLVAVYERDAALQLQRKVPNLTILTGREGLNEAASFSSADLVLSAMTGTVGLEPTLAAIEAGKDVALANKEALVSGGSLVMQKVKEKGIRLIPVDSEHSALFQCLQNQDKRSVKRLVLTASGGPFRTWTQEQLACATLEQALSHPNWKMGPKITIDCSTLMNKGLEVIEAHWLFGIAPDQIEVVIHPQSVIHSFVEYVDGSMMAQMSETSMLIPIQYALTYPERKVGLMKSFDFIRNPKLEFYFPDRERFRCLQLAYSACLTGKSLPGYMNAANEELVDEFMKKRIQWQEIPQKLETLMERHEVQNVSTLEEILEVDQMARREAAIIVGN